jgi:hypothetical protein
MRSGYSRKALSRRSSFEKALLDSAFWSFFQLLLLLSYFLLSGLQQQRQEMALLFERSSPARDYDFCMLARDIPEHACFL